VPATAEGASLRRERRGLLHGSAPPHTSAHAAWRAVTLPHGVRGERRASTPRPQRLLSARPPTEVTSSGSGQDAAVVVGVLLNAVVQGPDVLLRQEAQNVLLQGTGTLPGMISTRGAFLATASSMMARRARSISVPRPWMHAGLA